MQGQTKDGHKYNIVLDEKRQSWLGFVALGIFIVLWLLSISFPVTLVILLYCGYYKASFFGILLYAISYGPIPKVPLFQNLYSNFSTRYYKRVTLTYEENCDILDEKKPTMTAVHPHGLICLSWNTIFPRKEFQRFKFCFNAMLNTGFFRIVSQFVGNPSNVDKPTLTRLMKKNTPIALIPGGFEEASLFEYGKEQVFLKDRAGFIKMGLQYGYSITPLYGFQECFSYYNLFKGNRDLKLKLNKKRIPAAILFGNPLFPLLPFRSTELHIVGGKSLQLPKIENPSKEDVQKYHKIYIDELKSLFNRHKERFYGEGTNVELNII